MLETGGRKPQTAGVGYEYRMADGWGLMAEYTHYEFNNVLDPSFTPQINDPADGFYNGVDSFRADSFQISIVKRF